MVGGGWYGWLPLVIRLLRLTPGLIDCFDYGSFVTWMSSTNFRTLFLPSLDWAAASEAQHNLLDAASILLVDSHKTDHHLPAPH